MALTPTRAAALVVVACTLVAAAWLPPNPVQGGSAAAERWRSVQPVRRALMGVIRASRELSLAGEALLFLERRDSLAAALTDAERPMAAAAPDVPAAWTAWLAHPQPTVGAGSGVLAAVFLDSLAHRDRARRWDTWSNSTVTAFGPMASPFPCLIIHDLRRRVGRGTQRTLVGPDQYPGTNPLGICRFFATYGDPGPDVRAWLLAGGWYFGSSDGASHRGAFTMGTERNDAHPFLMADAAYTLASCVQGSAAGCRAWFLKHHEAQDMDRRVFLTLETPGAFITSWWGGGFTGLLDDLQAEMGPERFRTFWTSGLPVDSAFTAAFGTDVGPWALDWLERRYGPLPRRRPRGGDYAWTLVLATVMVVAAAGWSVRRTVG